MGGVADTIPYCSIRRDLHQFDTTSVEYYSGRIEFLEAHTYDKDKGLCKVFWSDMTSFSSS